MTLVEGPDPETLARIRELAERALTADEVREALAIPLGDEEEAEARSMIRWFCRRYATPGERLAYVRRAYRRWSNSVRTE